MEDALQLNFSIVKGLSLSSIVKGLSLCAVQQVRSRCAFTLAHQHVEHVHSLASYSKGSTGSRVRTITFCSHLTFCLQSVQHFPGHRAASLAVLCRQGNFTFEVSKRGGNLLCPPDAAFQGSLHLKDADLQTN